MFKRSSTLSLRLAIFAILSLCLMILDYRLPAFASVRSALDTIVLPIQYVVHVPVKTADWLAANFSSQQALRAENARLQINLLLLKSELQKIKSIENENNHLKALLHSSNQVMAKATMANIIALNPDPYVHQIIIDQGKKQGLQANQPIIDAEGVVGQIIQVGLFTSRAMLITDAHSAIPVQDTRSGVRGIVHGMGRPGLLKLLYMPHTSNIQVGDLLVTSGLGMRFPVGYPVGRVNSIHHTPGKAFSTIYVAPSAHLDRNRLVLILWPRKNLWQKVSEKQKIS